MKRPHPPQHRPQLWVGAAMVVVNLLMALVFVGAAGVVGQESRALDGDTVFACVRAAESASGATDVRLLTPTPDAVRFDGPDTIAFDARPADGAGAARHVRCVLDAPGADADAPLVVVSAEVTAS